MLYVTYSMWKRLKFSTCTDFSEREGGLTLTVASSFFDVIVASFLGIFVPKLVLQLTRA